MSERTELMEAQSIFLQFLVGWVKANKTKNW